MRSHSGSADGGWGSAGDAGRPGDSKRLQDSGGKVTAATIVGEGL
ncbi:hypothetical protein Aab01nite_30220 [Paractinoplanes abujensis]|nr:hypothetical protein Aab01nite_30220 [Actinoplanes abujensis]